MEHSFTLTIKELLRKEYGESGLEIFAKRKMKKELFRELYQQAVGDLAGEMVRHGIVCLHIFRIMYMFIVEKPI